MQSPREAFKEGDHVLVNTPMGQKKPSKKLYHPWASPYKVVKILSDADYFIRCKADDDIGKLSILIGYSYCMCSKNIHLDDELTSKRQPLHRSIKRE